MVLLIGLLTYVLIVRAQQSHYNNNGVYSPLVLTALAGAALALFWQQGAFIAHDALHNGVLVPRRNGDFNWLGWFHGSVIFGISSGTSYC